MRRQTDAPGGLGLAQELFQGLDSLFRLGESLRCPLLPRLYERPTLKSAKLEGFRADIWYLRSLFRSAVGSGLAEELIDILNDFSQNSQRYQRAFIVWVDLIEVLVQDTERRLGSQPGMGQIKSLEVKKALKEIARSGKFSIPNFPPFMQRLLFDFGIDWIIDMVVLQTNRYGLWEVTPEPRDALHRWFGRAWVWLRDGTVRLFTSVAEVCARIYYRLRPAMGLSPELRAALEAVEREGLIVSEQGLLENISRLIIWIGTHRDSLINSAELVFAAVQEAEMFGSLSGREKKEFAREAIWVVLEDFGFDPRSGLMTALLDAVIDFVIESSVHLFNKRNVFRHDASLPPAPHAT